MGLKIEHNTMIRLVSTDNIDHLKLKAGMELEIKRDNPRLYPVSLPLLLLKEDWTVLGYVQVTSLELEDGISEVEFKILKLFSGEVSKQYSEDLLEVLKLSGYL